MSQTSTSVAPALQAYFLETSAEAQAQLAQSAGPTAAEAPWAGRRLRHALADLGPAQPMPPDARAEPVVRTQPVGGVRRPLPPPPPPPAAPALGESAARDGADAGHDLPPAVASLIAALPLQALPDQVPLAPHEIVSALAGTGPVSAPAMPAPRQSEPMQSVVHERPPMIIERAHAERELRVGGSSADPARQSPLPALAAGFAFALATGAALYAVLALR